MGKINAVITGVGGYVPDYILNNEELSRMVDTIQMSGLPPVWVSKSAASLQRKALEPAIWRVKLPSS